MCCRQASADAAELIAGGRLQLGISRGSPEQVIDGWRYFGYQPAEGDTDADMARRHTGVSRQALEASCKDTPVLPRPRVKDTQFETTSANVPWSVNRPLVMTITSWLLNELHFLLDQHDGDAALLDLD